MILHRWLTEFWQASLRTAGLVIVNIAHMDTAMYKDVIVVAKKLERFETEPKFRRVRGGMELNCRVPGTTGEKEKIMRRLTFLSDLSFLYLSKTKMHYMYLEINSINAVMSKQVYYKTLLFFYQYFFLLESAKCLRSRVSCILKAATILN